MENLCCSVSGCQDLSNTLLTHPCLTCSSPVHHMCSNELNSGFDNKMFCSQECISTYRSSQHTEVSNSYTTPPPVESTGFNVIEHAGTPVPRSTAPQGTSGIPSDVLHDRQPGSSPVWSVIHQLRKKVRYGSKEYTHVCLLCASVNDASNDAPDFQWEAALCIASNSSNAWKHLLTVHPTHPLAIRKQAEVVAKACSTILEHNQAVTTVLGKRLSEHIDDGDDSVKPYQAAKRADITKFLRPSASMINTSIYKWLIDDGIAYNTITSDAFQSMIRVVSGRNDVTLLARESFNNLLDGDFSLFARSVKELVEYESEQALGLPFLSLLHDVWTSTAKASIIGASIAFIDSLWEFRHIAVLAAPKSDGHSASSVASLIRERCLQLYECDFVSMAKYTVSDTTASARKVSAYFDGSVQSDCSMHLLNLCISYGLGMKENTRTREVFSAQHDHVIKETIVVTPGGPLPEGRRVILKLRALNSHFSSPERLDKLLAIQRERYLPQLRPINDVDVRVGSTCKLMLRSMLNFHAYKAYFSAAAPGNVFDCITTDEWKLIAELEAIMYPLTALVLTEVQKDLMIASYMLYFRQAAEAKLTSGNFKCCNFGRPSFDTTEASILRETRPATSFSECGQRCITRTLEQLRARFPAPDSDAVMTLLPDPRTKDCAHGILSITLGATQATAMITEATAKLKQEHFRVSKLQHDKAARPESPEVEFNAASPLDEPVLPFDESFVFGAPVPSKTKRTIEESRLREDSDAAVERWLSHEELWVNVAHSQSGSVENLGALSKKLWVTRIDKEGRVRQAYSLDGLYAHIDIFQWFREVGTVKFPSISLLARLWLGKVSSTAFQERVFSTGAIVMTDLRTSTDGSRAEKQILMRHNRNEATTQRGVASVTL